MILEHHLPTRVLDPVAIGAAGVSVVHTVTGALPTILSEISASFSILWLSIQLVVWVKKRGWK